jgi:hypothetical protein
MIVLKVELDCGHVLEYANSIEEKYPFYCPACEETPEGKYPWAIFARIELDDYELSSQPG